MRDPRILAVTAGIAMLLASGGTESLSREPMPGGYSAAPVTNEQVVAAADFAVKAQEKAMQKSAPSAKLALVRIVSAQQQVVAGMNYRLRLSVKADGAEKEAEAVVWWQAWRKDEPYKLTSWDWK